jgi:hypothetical protein
VGGLELTFSFLHASAVDQALVSTADQLKDQQSDTVMTNKPKGKRRTTFVYNKTAREQGYWERRQMYEFDDKFREAIIRAYYRDTGPLFDLLCSNARLSSEHRYELAKLIRWGMGRKQPSRPRGSIPFLNPKLETQLVAQRFIVYEAQRLKSRRFGDQDPPRGGWTELIEQAKENCADHDIFSEEIDMQFIRNALKRRAKRKAKPSSTAPTPD